MEKWNNFSALLLCYWQLAKKPLKKLIRFPFSFFFSRFWNLFFLGTTSSFSLWTFLFLWTQRGSLKWVIIHHWLHFVAKVLCAVDNFGQLQFGLSFAPLLTIFILCFCIFALWLDPFMFSFSGLWQLAEKAISMRFSSLFPRLVWDIRLWKRLRNAANLNHLLKVGRGVTSCHLQLATSSIFLKPCQT